VVVVVIVVVAAAAVVVAVVVAVKIVDSWQIIISICKMPCTSR
jgi:hypothetical protein